MGIKDTSKEKKKIKALDVEKTINIGIKDIKITNWNM